MTALPVAHYLKELSGEPSRRGGRGFAALGASGASDQDAQLSDAHARGVLDGRAAAQQEHTAAVAALTASFDQKLAAERQKWAGDQGKLLAMLIGRSIGELERRISDRVGEVLKPIVSEQTRIRAVEELSHALAGMLSKGDYAKITISGPPDLLEKMEARLGNGYPGVSFVAGEGADLTVSADETIVETRIGAWAEMIAGDGS